MRVLSVECGRVTCFVQPLTTALLISVFGERVGVLTLGAERMLSCVLLCADLCSVEHKIEIQIAKILATLPYSAKTP